jgi:hypothetical protein
MAVRVQSSGGHYYGVSFNLAAVRKFLECATRLLFKGLNRHELNFAKKEINHEGNDGCGSCDYRFRLAVRYKHGANPV